MIDTLTMVPPEVVPTDMASLSEFVKDTASNNEFFSGGAVLAVLGGLAVWGRQMLISLLGMIDRSLRYQCTVNRSTDYIGFDALNYRMAKTYPHKMRNAVTKVHNAGGVEPPTMSLRPNNETIVIFKNWWFIVISKKRTRLDQSYNDVTFDEEYVLWTVLRKKAVLKFIIAAVDEAHIRDRSRQQNMLSVRDAITGNKQFLHTFKTFDTIYSGEAMRIRQDLDRFIASEANYKRLGIRCKRSYMLSGPAGTGKTSIAAAIAHYTKRALYVIPLEELESGSWFKKMDAENYVLLFDDVHAYWENPDKKVPISSLLGFLDGPTSPSDVIIVFTANRLDAMDPAFLREGRIDAHFHIGNATENDIHRFYVDYYKHDAYQPEDDAVMRVFTKAGAGQIPMCKVQEIALKSETAIDFISNLEKTTWTQQSPGEGTMQESPAQA